MTLKHSLSFIFCLAFTTIAVWAQSNKFSNSIFRFATRAEGQMLITELDDYTRNWNQFDIDVRLQKPQGRKSQLLQFAMEQTLNWSDAEKERISKAMKSLDAEIKKQSYNLDFPKEIIFVKTTQKEEGNSRPIWQRFVFPIRTSADMTVTARLPSADRSNTAPW